MAHTMTKDELLNILNIDDLRYAPEKIMEILNSPERDAFYLKLLHLNEFDMSFDWFQSVYEEEYSERKKKKQDFTPSCLGILCSELTGAKEGTLMEPTAGNGSMIISDWWNKAKKQMVWDYKPSKHKVECWELSDRSIPILLLNLSIRGICGIVHHGDVLERTDKACYELRNPKDDSLCFSQIIKVL